MPMKGCILGTYIVLLTRTTKMNGGEVFLAFKLLSRCLFSCSDWNMYGPRSVGDTPRVLPIQETGNLTQLKG